MNRAPLVLIALVGALLGTLAQSAPVEAKESLSVIDDTDYRFRLRSPGADWALLDEAAARALVPEAIAGAQMPSAPNVNGVVIAERSPGKDLDTYQALLLGNLQIENPKVAIKEDIQFQGLTARRVLVEGLMRNVGIRYQFVLFFRQEFAYQLVTWGLSSLTKADGSDFMPFVRAVELTDGPIKIRAYSATAPDMVGTGWSIKDNVFRSAITGLRVEPADGWRLIAGDELSTMNDDAEIGLASTSDPEVYLVLTTERVAGVDRAAMQKQYVSDLDVVDAPVIKTTVAGVSIAMPLYQNEQAAGYEFRHGVVWEGDTACQVLAWYAEAIRPSATASLQRALAGVTRMPGSERLALEKTLIAEGDQQRFVGPTFSLRGGQFTDFASGIRWTAPKGIWKLSTGQVARQVMSNATLVIEAPTTGLIGVVFHTADVEGDATTYLKSVYEGVFTPEETKAALAVASDVVVPGRPTLRTARCDSVENGQTFTYVLAGGVHGGVGTCLMIWGFPGNVATSEASVQAAIRGMDLAGAPSKAAERRDDRYIDHRMGFEFRSPNPQWRFREETPANLKPIGNLMRWTSKSEYVQALALCNIGRVEQTNTLLENMLTNVTRPFGSKPVGTAALVSGRVGTQLFWPNRARIWYVTNGRMVYMLIHTWRPGSTPTLSAAKAIEGFKLID